MSANDQSLLVAHEWMQKAENDLKSAVQILKLEKESPTDIVCFHSQQCDEKYLKAFLVYAQIDFPRTHDIEVLLSLVPPEARPDLSALDARMLSVYATVIRYPGDYDPVTLKEAKHGVSIARRIRRAIKKFIPSLPRH